MSKTRFGDTVPYFHIAREYNLDYADVLEIADMITHNRSRPHAIHRVKHKLDFSLFKDFDRDMTAQANRFHEIQRGAPY